MQKGSLDGQVAIITGAGSGIGEAIANLFATEGALVVVVDVDANAASSVAERLAGRVEAESVALDVTDCEAVQEMVRRVNSTFGRIDILVNNAGYSRFSPIEELEVEQWLRTIDVNLNGAFYCSLAVAQTMMKRRQGKIVNVASLAGLTGIPDQCAYVAAKHGLVGLTRALAIDLGPYGVNVNCICPATTLTPLALETRSQEFLETEPRHHPLGRLATPEDQARAALFLASPDADYLTGVIMPVDGGRLIAMRTRETQT
jgi:NAD(P)-dependent dehydrogenase (short-subunit alcohol dehydrogenase family)